MKRFREFMKRHGTESVFAVLALICAAFLVHVTSLSAVYSAGVSEEAERRAAFYSGENASSLQNSCEDLLREASFFATKLGAATSEEEAAQITKDFYLSEGRNAFFLSVCRFTDDGVISWDGTAVTGYSAIAELAGAGGALLSDVFQYDNRIQAIAASVACDSPYADRVAVLYDRSAVSLPDGENLGEGVSLSEFTLLCKHDGRILSRIENTDTFSLGNAPIREGILSDLLGSAELTAADQVLREGGSGVWSFRSGTDDYVLSLTSLGREGGYLATLSVYRVADIYGDGFAMMESIRASLLGLALMMVVMIVAMTLAHRESRKRFYRLEMVDAVLGCATPKKLEEDAAAILRRHRTTNFALVSLKINNFGYVSERFGDDAAEELAKYAAGVIRGALMVEETFAYEGEGAFLLFLH
ncbi:MAG TPA: hypothetical protein DDY70_03345, partial [Clostridiales bacterium]|nr:hypothetical protein [Clostridiales bacterium]